MPPGARQARLDALSDARSASAARMWSCRRPAGVVQSIPSPGIGHKTTIWFSQSSPSGQVRLIDYYENSGEGLPHYVGVLNEKRASRRFVYGRHWAPHDIRVKELGTGKSRYETAAGLGIKFDVVRRLPVDDGINAARLLLPRCWFDEEQCRTGIEALTFYRKDYNERMQQYSATPFHDWASHGADAFRGLAVRHKTPERARPKRRQMFHARHTPGPQHWAG